MQNTTPSHIDAYQIIEQIGSGGMATIYRAHQPRLGRDVAIKVVHSNLAQDRNYSARFEREAKIIARLDHPNIVPLYDYADFNGQPYLVMKYIDGTTLKELLKHGSLSLEVIRDIMMRVAKALEYAHTNGILHRDIKPSNILLDRNGVPYLTDFGLARIVLQGESTLSTDMILGTPQYISPEQARGKDELDARSDVYSFGIVLYELVVGSVPFVADSAYGLIYQQIYEPPLRPAQLNPEIPAAVEQVLLKALEKSPQDRYPTPMALMYAFESAITESHLTALDEDRQSMAIERSIVASQEQYENASGRLVTVPAPGQASIARSSDNFWVALSERIRQGVEDLKERVEQSSLGTESSSAKPKRTVSVGWVSERSIQSPGDQLAHIGAEYGTDENSIRQRVNQRLQRRRSFFAYAAVYVAVVVLTATVVQPGFNNALDTLSTQPDVVETIARVGGNFLTPLRTLSLTMIVALLGASGVIFRGIQVFYDSGGRLENKRRRIETELEDAYGAAWQSSAGEGAYYRVRNRVEQGSRRTQGLLAHLLSAIFFTLAVVLAWPPVRDALQIFAVESSQFETLIGLPIPAYFAAIMGFSFLGHILTLVLGYVLNAEPGERLIAQELERELQSSGLSTLAEKRKNVTMVDEDTASQVDKKLVDEGYLGNLRVNNQK